MEDKPIFQFKKAKITVDGIDPDSPSEWELLIRAETHDLPSFCHFHKLWIRAETPDETDTEGNITKPGVKQVPAVQVYKGFIKDEKFVVTGQQIIQANTFHECHKKFKHALETAIRSNGFRKDESRYTGIFGQPQQYYSNERTLLSGQGIQTMTHKDILNIVQNQGIMGTNGSTIPIPAPTPAKKKKSISDIFNSIKPNNP